jgi:hypothetical protein
MTVQEIKLAFQKNINFSISSDLEAQIDKGYELVSKGNDLLKQAQLSFTMANNSFSRAVETSDKGILAKKELGEDTKFYEQKKQMAKDGLTKANKGQSINVV